MTNDIINDSITWDIFNWSKSIAFWESTLNKEFSGLEALELGGGDNGGLSVWLASKGCIVTCSGYKDISDNTKEIHSKYKFSKNISYSRIDALSIPFENKYDIVCFKSMLGGIVRGGSFELAEKVISEIYKSLKPGGTLLFSENIISSPIHRHFRRIKKYSYGRNTWRYLGIDEINRLLQIFDHYDYTTFGFLGCFGRSETQRTLFGRIDSVIFDKLSEKQHYIYTGLAQK